MGSGTTTLDPLRPHQVAGQHLITLNSLRQKAWGEGETNERMGEDRRGRKKKKEEEEEEWTDNKPVLICPPTQGHQSEQLS